MSRLGVGIIGLSAHGGWAARAHLPALRALTDKYIVTGVAASTPERAAAAAAANGIAHAAESPEALAARDDVDLVVVAVKVPEHRHLVQAALAGGKAVLCEWPLAVDEAEAASLAHAAGMAEVRNFVGLQARFAPALQQLKRLIEDNSIGEVIASNLLAAVAVPWNGNSDSRRTYLNRRASGATMLTIPFGHCLDALQWILSDFVELRASLAVQRMRVTLTDTDAVIDTDVPDQIIVGGRLTSGASAAIHYRGGYSPAGNFRWEINGSKGDLLITGGDGHLQYGLVRIAQGSAGSELAELPVPASDLPPLSRAVAGQYAAIHRDITTGSRTVPDFAHARRRHAQLARIEQGGDR